MTIHLPLCVSYKTRIALPSDEVANFTIPALPQEQPAVMPIQSFKRQVLSKRKLARSAKQRIKEKLLAKLDY